MRLRWTLLASLMLMLPARAEEAKSYTLTIGDVSVGIDPGETLDVTLPGGGTARVTLALNEFAGYSGDMFSFVHPTSVAVTKTALGDDIDQHLMATALGTLVIIQEYATLDPTSLYQLMLDQLTGDLVKAGGELKQDSAARSLADGKQLTGIKATVTTRAETTDFEILGYGEDGRGILLVTRIDRENAEADSAMIGRFWSSLEIDLK